MNRLVLLAGMLAMLAGIAEPASAVRSRSLNWLTSSATQSGGVVDSVVAVGDDLRADTLQAVAVSWLTIPGKLSLAAVDTAIVAQLQILPLPATSSGVTVVSDTVYVTEEVSMDGVTWVALTPTSVFIASGLGPAGAITNGKQVLETSANNSFVKPIRMAYNSTGGLQFGTSEYQLWGWNLVRWIVTGSASHEGAYRARIVTVD
jgi:hypothetical protein